MKVRGLSLLLALLLALSLFCGCAGPPSLPVSPPEGEEASPAAPPAGADEAPEAASFDPAAVPAYSGDAYAAINGNTPFFRDDELTDEVFEEFSQLDTMGRCGMVWASVGRELMPTEERGSIGSVKPTGWQTVRYDGLVDGNYLYNRCHLIGFQLTGENANTRNLITGTRYLNIEGMLPFENMVADYVKETGNHVMYRVTPVFAGDNLVADGVLMEGRSVEDDGICFCVFAYNVQPGVEIDYATGESRLADAAPSPDGEADGTAYILNTNTMKYHDPDCASAEDIREENRQTYTGSAEALAAQGYEPCGRCQE